MFIHMLVLNDSQNIIAINKNSNILQFQLLIKLFKFQMFQNKHLKKKNNLLHLLIS